MYQINVLRQVFHIILRVKNKLYRFFSYSFINLSLPQGASRGQRQSKYLYSLLQRFKKIQSNNQKPATAQDSKEESFAN